MNIKVQRRNPDWPKAIGPEAHEVLAEFTEKMDGLTWFLMGRSLLSVVSIGELDESDTDIDIACLAEDEDEIRDRFTGWDYVQHTFTDRTHQLMYQPRGVLVDIHFFSETPEHYGYVNQFNKWVTRPASRFAESTIDTERYGPVRVPYEHEKFLHDDYGPDWRDKYA